MRQKNFFLPRYFNPSVCKVLANACKTEQEGNITFRMYCSGNTAEYEVIGYRLFLPNTVLNGYRFGKIDNTEKKLILHLSLSEDNFITLIRKLGGTVKKISPSSKFPTLGDFLKL